MFYGDLRPARSVYENGENVTSFLKEQFSVKQNSSEIIEIAYDLQSGSYIDFVRENSCFWREYTSEIAEILGRYCLPTDKVLDVGTGEMTTMVGVAQKCYGGLGDYFACDISWSRLFKGKGFLQEKLEGALLGKITPFVADLFRLPFVDGAMDIVWTSHALEPNGGREKEALTELLRVARKKLILFEPSFESNSSKGKERMERLGYVKGIAKAVEECGARCDDIIPLKNINNPLNPTHAFIVTPPGKVVEIKGKGAWACPATGFPMSREEDCFWSEYSMLAYPVLRGIPVLRPESAILASALEPLNGKI